MSQVFVMSAMYEWKTFDAVEAGTHEAWAVVDKSQPANPHSRADVGLALAIWVTRDWQTKDPEGCAKLLDEAGARYVKNAGPAGKREWEFLLPGREQNILMAASKLPLERRRAFFEKREASLQVDLADNSVSMNGRSNRLTAWAQTLRASGNVERALELLDDWWQRHSDEITSTQYFHARFFAARQAKDPAKADKTLQKAKALVESGKIQPDDYYRMMLNAPPLKTE
jgi:hypothetical protein